MAHRNPRQMHPPGHVLAGPSWYDGSFCRVRVADDGKEVVPEIWVKSQWVPGGRGSDPAMGFAATHDLVIRKGIPRELWDTFWAGAPRDGENSPVD